MATIFGENDTAELAKLRDRNEILTIRVQALWVVIAVFGILTFKSDYERLDEGSNTEAYAVSSTWWGLWQRSTKLEWTTVDRGSDYEYQAWCYRNPDGYWARYFVSWD